MTLSHQLSVRRAQTDKTLRQISKVTGIASPNVSNVLRGKTDARTSTLEALADALDATWVLVPKHLIPEVERLLSGKVIGPDAAPSTVDQLFGGGFSE